MQETKKKKKKKKRKQKHETMETRKQTNLAKIKRVICKKRKKKNINKSLEGSNKWSEMN